MSKRPGRHSSVTGRSHEARLTVAGLAASLLVLTLAAPASAKLFSADVFAKAYGWGVSDGGSSFQTCTSSCQAGTGGGGAGQLNEPEGVATDGSGEVYAADTSNHRIDEFSAAGAFIKAYGWGVSDGGSSFETCTSSCQAGIVGGGAGDLVAPVGVVTDGSGNVYVSDTGNYRVDEFSAAGAFIKAYGWGVSDGGSAFQTCTSSCQAGIEGGGAGQLNEPEGVATDGSGDVYVADLGNDRVDEFSAAGAFIKAYGWGVSDGGSSFQICTSSCQVGIGGGGAGQLNVPVGVATEGSGDVYVADYANRRVDKFSAAGAFIKAYGWGVSDGGSSFETCTSSCQAGTGGGGAGQLNVPEGVATDGSGDVYVSDNGNSRVNEFSAAGAFIKAYGWGVSDGGSSFQTCTSSCQAGTLGGGAGQLSDPNGVATDGSGDVYIADTGNNRIDEFVGLRTLDVSIGGTGHGRVSGSGISCPGRCAKTYVSGTALKLTARPSAGSRFAGWSGCHTAKAVQCTVTMSADRHVTAHFQPLPPNTKITKSTLNQKHHQATFSFTANGSATGFQCALVKHPNHHHQTPTARFTSCKSPKTYEHLKADTYTFEVRGINAGGADGTPAKKSFTIR